MFVCLGFFWGGGVGPPDGLVRLWIPVGMTSSGETESEREGQREREMERERVRQRNVAGDVIVFEEGAVYSELSPTTQRPAWWQQEILTFPEGASERKKSPKQEQGGWIH